jgi:hypothetical protein
VFCCQIDSKTGALFFLVSCLLPPHARPCSTDKTGNRADCEGAVPALAVQDVCPHNPFLLPKFRLLASAVSALGLRFCLLGLHSRASRFVPPQPLPSPWPLFWADIKGTHELGAGVGLKKDYAAPPLSPKISQRLHYVNCTEGQRSIWPEHIYTKPWRICTSSQSSGGSKLKKQHLLFFQKFRSQRLHYVGSI